MRALLKFAPILVFLTLILPRPSRADARNPFSEPTRLLWVDGVQNAYPRWSRDGSQILFQSNRSGKWQIYVMNRNGTDEHRILPSESNQNFPDWSPDNNMVAFVSDRDGNEEVYVAKMDGSGMTNLSNHPGRDIHPYWAPDGKRLLFNSNRDKEESFDIYSVETDGGHLTRLTETDAVETCARLSPDGERIVCLRGDTNDEVVVMNPDGSEPRNVTRTTAAEGWPAWSPDGKRIIYSSATPDRFSLFLMNADGSGKRQISAPPAPFFDGRAIISPDGRFYAWFPDDASGRVDAGRAHVFCPAAECSLVADLRRRGLRFYFRRADAERWWVSLRRVEPVVQRRR